MGGKLDNFKLFFWNPDTKKCMGRTGDSWLKLIGFYIALYSCLAALWSLYYAIFHLTISDKYPKWQLDESIIGTNPGVGMRPQSPRQRVESALISYQVAENSYDFKHWVDDLNLYLEEFDINKRHDDDDSGTMSAITNNNNNKSTELPLGQNLQNNKHQTDRRPVKVNCSGKKTREEEEETICPFDNSTIPIECTAMQNFSFPSGQPCILIKLNRIYGWRPKVYDFKPINYPDDAPFTPGNIQITCAGQHDPDKEHLGELAYYPQNGIETKYYPFLNQAGYQSPYVMVHFKNPKLNTLIYIECKAWAQNIEHDRYNRKGMTTFELFIEKATS